MVFYDDYYSYTSGGTEETGNYLLADERVTTIDKNGTRNVYYREGKYLLRSDHFEERIKDTTEHQFWLSETPTVPGTIYPGQSDNPRCCTDAVLFEDPKLSVVSKDIGATYHGYGRAKHPSLIDYIVLRGALSCEKIRKWTDEKDGVYLSDHYPVCADIAIC